MKHSRFIWCGMLLVCVTGVSCVSVQPKGGTRDELKRIRTELEALHGRIEEQGKMIRTLYEFVDAEVDLENQQRQAEEEASLLLETIREIADPNLSSIGCANPAAPQFAVKTSDGGVRVYDADGRIAHSLKLSNEIIEALSYSWDGRLLLAGTEAGALLVWEPRADKCRLVARQVAESVGRVAWLSGTKRVIWGTYVDYHGEGGAKINRDKASGAVLDRGSGDTCWTYKAFVRDDFQTLAASPDGKKLAILEIPDAPRGAFVLDGATGSLLVTLFHEQHPSGPLSVCIGPDNETVAVGYAPTDVILWDARTGKFLKILEGHSNWVVSLGFSQDGRFLISGAGDSTARMWCIETGKEVGRLRFPGSSTYVESVGFSPDGTMVFGSAEGKLVIAKTL